MITLDLAEPELDKAVNDRYVTLLGVAWAAA
jgi:hypothetical protein